MISKVLITFLIFIGVMMIITKSEDIFPRGKDLFEKHYGAAAMYEELSEADAEASEALYFRRLQSSQNNQGYAYYAFYGQKNCGGAVTYSSGIPANVCLPGKIYDFGGNYYYYSAIRAYKSFMLTNLNTNCEGTNVIFYSDDYCKEYVSTQSLTAANQYNNNQVFTSCYTDGTPASTAMLSYQGFCSVGEEVPVSTSSYVLREYNGTAGCSSTDLQTFSTYSINTCFGYNNHSSASYSCSTTNGNVAMSQYYSTKTCTADSVSFYQTSLNIVAGCFRASTALSAPFDQYAYSQASCQMVDSSSDDSLSNAAIAGIVVGSIVGAGLIFGIIAFIVFGGKGAVLGTGAAGASGAAASGVTNPLNSPTKGTELI